FHQKTQKKYLVRVHFHALACHDFKYQTSSLGKIAPYAIGQTGNLSQDEGKFNVLILRKEIIVGGKHQTRFYITIGAKKDHFRDNQFSLFKAWLIRSRPGTSSTRPNTLPTLPCLP
ncbi:MAG: hypothetical protein KC563_06440, partial [Nitrospira sp.]|nr:hypothetical protein [Nitrospira sp.]